MKISQPVPALPVQDVKAAQTYYQDRLGFEIAWHHEEGRIGGVAYGECAIFFREIDGTIPVSVLWVFAADVDATYQELLQRGAEIVEPPEDKPWGLRQFTIRDLNGHLYHFHHDL